MWKVPRQVVTPDLEEDIKRLLSPEILRLFKLCEDEEKKVRIQRITEMLDFLDHLSDFRNYLNSINKRTKREENGMTFIDSSIIFNGHDYSGCEFDIEALMYYMYVSIIDTSMAKVNIYISLKDFMKDRISKENTTKTNVLALCDEYNNLYGLSKNFKDVFESRIPSELQEKFANGILILSDNRKTGYAKADIDDRWEKWKKKELNLKMTRIASGLYNIRSSYTHSNIRNFIPSRKWDGDILDSNVRYLLQEDTDLLGLLKSVILELCVDMLTK
ncbi:MAG: hypothetical protein K2P55_12095 [Bacteroides acidifaciens]|uniref:hypothetical protein n=1 Tax=Bacteroides acidifaciens TaxID=85831 RepID=UPI0023CE8E18|nr:hypothetical protein [Bacteroides acidifaciens]MDE6820863.1 hypothetical protein [Bacteroides acidifaciens]MDE6987630.1 hypothetical protein [Bacteroides acidifaciens]